MVMKPKTVLKMFRVNGKVVGAYDEANHLYVKYVRRNVHRFWKYNAYGIQETVVEELQKIGCETVQIIEETGDCYTSYFVDWLKKKPEDFGFGAQRFLAIERMKHGY